MVIVHLAASPFFGGPERQMLGLARALPSSYRSIFLSFAERGLCQPFLNELHKHGFEALSLQHNFPHFLKSAREIKRHLVNLNANMLCCHGYKADLIGWLAARMAGIPVISVSRGWTGATARVRLYERLDRGFLPHMDCVACVSEGQAAKVRRTGVSEDRLRVIRNSIDTSRFDNLDSSGRQRLAEFFSEPPSRIILAAGRLSPEKGFDQLLESAPTVIAADPSARFILFGDGPLRPNMERRIAELNLQRHFILAGFRSDVDRFIPHADLIVLPSFTEGLPNVALEALAASVPVVATAVGGTPEVVQDGISGRLVPPGDPPAIAAGILDVLQSEDRRSAMGQRGRQHVLDHFTFNAQAIQYVRLFESLSYRHGDNAEALSPAHELP